MTDDFTYNMEWSNGDTCKPIGREYVAGQKYLEHKQCGMIYAEFDIIDWREIKHYLQRPKGNQRVIDNMLITVSTDYKF